MGLRNISVFFCPLERKAELEKNAVQNMRQKEFVYVWEKWGYWDKGTPPIVAEINGQIVGFVAVAFLKKDYVNLYYICVLPEFRCCGVAAKLLSFVYEEMKRRNFVRLKLKAVIDSIGDKYWRDQGMFCVGYDKKHNYYDTYIEMRKTIRFMRKVMPMYMRNSYLKRGVTLL